MDEIHVDNGDITLRVGAEGEGPVVLCVHGWPELASSWHHQVRHLAARGFRAAAMDVRGYGGSSAPPEIERYRLAELASDVAAVAAALDDGPIDTAEVLRWVARIAGDEDPRYERLATLLTT